MSTTQSGYAIDGRPESPRQYPPGKELAHAGNANLAKTTDLANTREK